MMDGTDREIRHKYRRLLRAIPRLPKPKHLYKKIVQTCRRSHAAAIRMTTLVTRIKNLCNSQKGWKDHLAELQIVETLRDKAALEFTLIRTELRTLFAIPPLLIAMEFISEANWRAMMSQPQYDEEDHSILMDQSTIEAVIEDQLQILNEQQSLLNDYRETLQREENAEKEQFQSKVISLFDQVQDTLEKGLEEATKVTHDIVRNALKEMTKTTTTLIHETTQTDSVASLATDAGSRKRHLTENAEKDDDEAEKIKENAEYMEEIEEMETGDEKHLSSHNNEENTKREEAIYDIWEEIEHVEREIDDCEATINELDVLTICRSRDFKKGVIRNELESGMRCAFCNKIGDHYSDSCATHPSVKDRLYILRQESRCHMCLQIAGGLHYCRKSETSCFHCRRYGHHSALCQLPERSDEIRRSLVEATERRRNAKRRLEDLRTRLAELQG